MTGPDEFNRERWAALATRAAVPLGQEDVQQLVATGDPVALDEAVEIYLPLAQFLAQVAAAAGRSHEQVSAFLGQDRPRPPFIVGIAGGVAVGKSTTARMLQALLRAGEGRPSVDLLTTDGFLYPNDTLARRGLMERKGFPESYDQRALVGALAALRAGQPEVATPVYSHLAYDIVPGQFQYLRRPDIVLVEGLNVLQVTVNDVVVSDFFDFSIYVDAAEEDVARWFTERLLDLRATVLDDPGSFFHRFASFGDAEMTAFAEQIWTGINLVNLRENVAPTRGRADLILEKGGDHRVHRITLRRS